MPRFRKEIIQVLKRMFCLTAIVGIFWTVAAITQEKEVFTADRHKEMGFSCEVCHQEAEPTTPASGKSCLACHESMEAMAEKTKDFVPNPHDNHMTQSSNIECTQCHQGHKADVSLCEQCHAGLTFQKIETGTE